MAQWLRCLAPKGEFADSILRRIPLNWLAWSLYKFAALLRAVYGPSATKRSLGTIREGKGISGFLSLHDLTLAVESYVKPCSFLPSFLLMTFLFVSLDFRWEERRRPVWGASWDVAWCCSPMYWWHSCLFLWISGGKKGGGQSEEPTEMLPDAVLLCTDDIPVCFSGFQVGRKEEASLRSQLRCCLMLFSYVLMTYLFVSLDLRWEERRRPVWGASWDVAWCCSPMYWWHSCLFFWISGGKKGGGQSEEPTEMLPDAVLLCTDDIPVCFSGFQVGRKEEASLRSQLRCCLMLFSYVLMTYLFVSLDFRWEERRRPVWGANWDVAWCCSPMYWWHSCLFLWISGGKKGGGQSEEPTEMLPDAVLLCTDDISVCFSGFQVGRKEEASLRSQLRCCLMLFSYVLMTFLFVFLDFRWEERRRPVWGANWDVAWCCSPMYWWHICLFLWISGGKKGGGQSEEPTEMLPDAVLLCTDDIPVCFSGFQVGRKEEASLRSQLRCCLMLFSYVLMTFLFVSLDFRWEERRRPVWGASWDVAWCCSPMYWWHSCLFLWISGGKKGGGQSEEPAEMLPDAVLLCTDDIPVCFSWFQVGRKEEASLRSQLRCCLMLFSYVLMTFLFVSLDFRWEERRRPVWGASWDVAWCCSPMYWWHSCLFLWISGGKKGGGQSEEPAEMLPDAVLLCTDDISVCFSGFQVGRKEEASLRSQLRCCLMLFSYVLMTFLFVSLDFRWEERRRPVWGANWDVAWCCSPMYWWHSCLFLWISGGKKGGGQSEEPAEMLPDAVLLCTDDIPVCFSGFQVGRKEEASLRSQLRCCLMLFSYVLMTFLFVSLDFRWEERRRPVWGASWDVAWCCSPMYWWHSCLFLWISGGKKGGGQSEEPAEMLPDAVLLCTDDIPVCFSGFQVGRKEEASLRSQLRCCLMLFSYVLMTFLLFVSVVIAGGKKGGGQSEEPTEMLPDAVLLCTDDIPVCFSGFQVGRKEEASLRGQLRCCLMLFSYVLMTFLLFVSVVIAGGKKGGGQSEEPTEMLPDAVLLCTDDIPVCFSGFQVGRKEEASLRGQLRCCLMLFSYVLMTFLLFVSVVIAGGKKGGGQSEEPTEMLPDAVLLCTDDIPVCFSGFQVGRKEEASLRGQLRCCLMLFSYVLMTFLFVSLYFRLEERRRPVWGASWDVAWCCSPMYWWRSCLFLCISGGKEGGGQSEGPAEMLPDAVLLCTDDVPVCFSGFQVGRKEEASLRGQLRCCLMLSEVWEPNIDTILLLWDHFYKRLVSLYANNLMEVRILFLVKIGQNNPCFYFPPGS